MKWIKFLEEYDGHKAGEVVSLDNAEAAVLIKMKKAEATDEPKEVSKAVTEQSEQLKKEMGAALDEFEKSLGDRVTAIVNSTLKDASKGINKRPNVTVGDDNEDKDPTFGFKDIGEYGRLIKQTANGMQIGPDSDVRIKRIWGLMQKAPTTYASEGTGADGGFLIPPEFSNQLKGWAFDDEALLSLTDQYPTASNNLTIPKDETTPWGSTGVQSAWTGEGKQITQSKIAVGRDDLKLEKLTTLVPVTSEQLDDSFMGLGAYLAKKAGQAIRWKSDDAIINGTGAGMPMGIINSGALITQTADAADSGAVLTLADVGTMMSRIPNLKFDKCVWLAHPSVFPQVIKMTNGYNSLFVPPGGLQGTSASFSRMMGIKYITSQHCQVLGTPGDIYLLDLDQYISLVKTGGIQSAMSIHLYFDYDMAAFRFIFRQAGQPWMTAPITSAYGSYTQSPFVNLATRS